MTSKYRSCTYENPGIFVKILKTNVKSKYAVEKYCKTNIKGIQPKNPTDNTTIENIMRFALSNRELKSIDLM